MSAHTPGPWEFSGDGIFGVCPLNVRVRLADVIFHNRLNRIDSEANARVMAAGPELLAALKALMDTTRDERLADEAETYMDAIEAREAAEELARAAIAKAEGVP